MLGVAAVGCALSALARASAQVPSQRVPAAPAETGTGTIAGRVELVEMNQRTPLRRATVRLAGQRASLRETLTDTEGRFSFAALAADNYRFDVVKPGFALASPTTGIDLDHNARLTVNVEAQRAGALSGRILEEHGLPVDQWQVMAVRIDVGKSASYTATTDDLGRFRVHSLPPGRYVIRAAQPAAADEHVYYPGTTARAEAG